MSEVAQAVSELQATNPPPQKAVVESTSETLGTLTAQARTAPRPEANEPTARPQTAVTLQTAVALLTESWSNHKPLWIGGAAFAGLIFLWIAVRIRQPRDTVRITLVPRSLDQE